MRAAPRRAILPDSGSGLCSLSVPQLSGVSVPGSRSRPRAPAAHINPRLASRALRRLVLRACAQQAVDLPVVLPLDPVPPGASRALRKLPTDARQQVQEPQPPLCHGSRSTRQRNKNKIKTSPNKADHDVGRRFWLGDEVDSKQRRALGLAPAQRRIAVVGRTDEWRGEQRRAQAFLSFGTFQCSCWCKVKLSGES